MRRYGEVHQPAVPQQPGAPVTSRGKARSNGPLRFHTDRCDVVALLCMRRARAGGISRVVSTVAMSNVILERRPDLHALLCQDYHRTREGEEAGGERSVYALPVFGMRDGHFTSQYSRTFVEAAQRWPACRGSPRRRTRRSTCSPTCAGALPRDGARARRHPAPEQPRHLSRAHRVRGRRADGDRLLLRLWLSRPNSRPLPAGFEALWGTIEAGALRGGIAQTAARG